MGTPPTTPDPQLPAKVYEDAAALHERNAIKISARKPQGPTDGRVAEQERGTARAARALGKAARQEGQ